MDKCETCRWWGGRIVGRTYMSGLCRRYPPAVIVRGKCDEIQQAWPNMHIGDFCGEHTPKDRA